MATLVEHNEYWSYHLVAQLCFYEGAKLPFATLASKSTGALYTVGFFWKLSLVSHLSEDKKTIALPSLSCFHCKTEH